MGRNSGKGRNAPTKGATIITYVLSTMFGVIAAGALLFLLTLGQTTTVPGEQQIPDQGNEVHIPDAAAPHIAYNSNPPTSGPHTHGQAPWGVLQEPVPDEVTLHNLEQGGVIVHYRQDLDPTSVEQLVGLTNELRRRNTCLILIPRPGARLDTPIAATAWNYLLPLQTVDTEILTQFVQAHVGHGPQTQCSQWS